MAATPFLELLVHSLEAVLQLFAMAAAGILCTRIGLVNATSRKFLSEMSFKITIPCLLFSNIIKCPGHVEKRGDCQSLLSLLHYSWPFFILPFVWVALGALVGATATCLARTPPQIRGTAMAACTFGNSTAVPIVLLTALSGMRFGDLHGKDLHVASRLRLYLSFLSIYLTVYQILLWSVGNWLLRWVPEDRRTVTPEGSFVSVADNPLTWTGDLMPTDLESTSTADARHADEKRSSAALAAQSNSVAGPTLNSFTSVSMQVPLARDAAATPGLASESPDDRARPLATPDGRQGIAEPEDEVVPKCMLLRTVVGWTKNFFVPPVIAILLGLAVGTWDGLRAILVHMPGHSPPPFAWLFLAIKRFGGAAVPMVMTVLGASLAGGFDKSAIHWPTTVAVALGRLVVMPAIAFAGIWASLAVTTSSGWFGTQEHLEAAVTVALVVSAAPTANNVVVMAELWGGPVAKQSLGAMIFVQYCIAPLSLTAWICALMTIVNGS